MVLTDTLQNGLSNLSLYSLYYAEACNEFAGPISVSLRPGNTTPFEEMSQRWRAVGNTVSNLTGQRFGQPETGQSERLNVLKYAKKLGKFSAMGVPAFFVSDY